jgi:hypothetical protein
MAFLFVLVTCGAESSFAFVHLILDQSAARSATLTKITRALLTSRLLFMIIETRLISKVSVA